ncbi:MAG: YecA family protein [Proteobacteria bacterium]|nr:MAG: YecA family protein [Pseudomonadota bacterium]QKK11274.1 MAG: UPF0149 family protein [Pseudomonadota bacterium]
MSTPSQLTIYQTFDDLLDRIGSAIGAAEAHGLLCGLLCAAREAVHDVWLTQLVSEGSLVEEDEGRLRAVVDETARQLGDVAFGFDLVLPGDDETLAERATALGEWCHGFIVGSGLGKLETDSEAVQEVLEDLTEISQISAQPEDCETDEDEDSYAELVEYVRVAVLLVTEQALNPPPAPPRDTPFLH